MSANYGYGSSSGSSYFDVTGLSYDDAGNITGLQRDDDSGSLIDNLTYNYSGSNRLQSISDAVSTTSESWDAEDASFGYDAGGNLISQSGKLDDVAYEHRNLPTQFALATNDILIANYNADGQRILKELKDGSWQFYVMDGQQTLAVIDNNGFSHFNLVGNNVFGRYTDSGARRYYITDHLGSTRAVVDNNDIVLETFDYYPFGLLMPKRNTAGANTLEKFAGKERDDEGGLNLDYFGARYYDAALGRWLSTDPLADERPSLSPYNYVRNNPLAYLDPNGLFDEYYSKGGDYLGSDELDSDNVWITSKENYEANVDEGGAAIQENSTAITDAKLSLKSWSKLFTDIFSKAGYSKDYLHNGMVSVVNYKPYNDYAIDYMIPAGSFNDYNDAKSKFTTDMFNTWMTESGHWDLTLELSKGSISGLLSTVSNIESAIGHESYHYREFRKEGYSFNHGAKQELRAYNYQINRANFSNTTEAFQAKILFTKQAIENTLDGQ